MSAEITQHLRTLAADGIRIHIWPTKTGYHANLAETGSDGWTCHTAEDPITALLVVLRLKCGRVADRAVSLDESFFEPRRAVKAKMVEEEPLPQLPLEDGDDEFGSLFE
jgi:hypothetical protein